MKDIPKILLILALITGLRACTFPILAESFRKENEIKFGEPIEARENYRDRLELLNSLPPKKLADNAEVILVSGYELEDSLRTGNEIEVVVDRPGKNVVLIFSSYEKVIWKVEASPTTKIKGILVSSYQEKSKLVTTVDTTAFAVSLPYAYDVESENFAEALKHLNQLFDIEEVSAFEGSYSLPSKIEILQLNPVKASLTPTGLQVQKPFNNFEFTLYDLNYQPVRWTLLGASHNGNEYNNSDLSLPTEFAVSPDNTKIYELLDNGIKVTERQTGEQNIFELPDNFPELSWVSGIAYDSKRNIVSLVSFGGEGFLYRFDAENLNWLDVRSVNNIDMKALTYDKASDRYVALTDTSLLFISGSGELLFQERIVDLVEDIQDFYNIEPVFSIVANSKDIALIAYSKNSVKAIWYYNLDSKNTQLTYQSQ